MKALLLAAGYGTRLYPLTEDRPKSLLRVGGRPILDWIGVSSVSHDLRPGQTEVIKGAGREPVGVSSASANASAKFAKTTVNASHTVIAKINDGGASPSSAVRGLTRVGVL